MPHVNRPDGTFGFAYMDFQDNFTDFLTSARKQIEKVQGVKGLGTSHVG
jgi:chloramphenicol O-acetyltransferase type A